jgi:glycosyltransferase involved in cell wall biosynthesis
VKPRVLFVGRGRLALPLAPWLQKKWDALSDVLELRVLNAGSGAGDARFRMLPTSAAVFYAELPREVARALRSFRPDAVVVSDPYLGTATLLARRVARVPAKVIVEVHGDPRTFTRSYGSSLRQTVSPVADAIARFGIRHADATRALSAFTSSLVEEVRGRGATACFPTYSDLSAFTEPPLVPVPEARRLVFVAALERYKNIDGLAAAWRRVAAALPDALLTIVGDGSRGHVVDELVRDLPGRVVHHRQLLPHEVADELDAARALVLPSWPEGLGRVVLEAFARGRTVVATNAGGIRDIVTDGRDGILIPPADTEALVEGMRRVLEERGLAEHLGAAAHDTYRPWHQTPEDFARAYRDLVERVLAGAR